MAHETEQGIGARERFAAQEYESTKRVRESGRPDPEVQPKAKRRHFSEAYKLSVLEEIDRSAGQTGAILRREGLYSSHLADWRRARRTGSLKALASKKRGPKSKSKAELDNEKLRRENARLRRELEKAQVLIGAQKKLAEILGVDLPRVMANNDEGER